jgi:hypothetical protein
MTLATRIGLRFFFIYFTLYIFPFPLGWMTFTELAGEFYTDFWLYPINWTAGTILGFDHEITIKPAGSGDTTYNYIQILIFAFIALTGTIVWSLLDRGRKNYDRLWYWFTIYLRYYLGVVMLSYGFAKVIPLQFPSPSLEHLSQPIGESSPMGLLWTFMGFSTAYNVFAGLAEVTGGILLFFKRTRVLGCLVVIAVMSNVAMLNFTYDVPVKLFSLHLLGVAVLLIVPDLKRLINFFILNRVAEPSRLEPVYSTPSGKTAYYLGKSIFMLAFTALPLMQSFDMYRKYRDPVRPPLYGIYDVEAFAWRGDTLSLTGKDTRGWKRLTINKAGSANIRYLDGVDVLWKFEADTSAHTLTLSSQNASNASRFNYRVDGALYMLSGSLNGNDIYVRMRKKEYLLVNRGFHWINEYPFNR